MELVSPGQLPIGLPDGYTLSRRAGRISLKLPSQHPLFALFAVFTPVWVIGVIGSLYKLNFADVVACGVGLGVFWWVSWPALIHREVEIEPGLVTRRWTLLGGPGIFWRCHGHVTRVIATSKRRNAIESTDAVWIEDGAGRHKIDSVTNSPEGSFRWFANWQVGPPPRSPFYRSDRPTESMSPAILAVARILADELGAGAFLEVEPTVSA